MPELKVLNRVVAYDPASDAILLVRNQKQTWWCAPGGGWEYDREALVDGAQREVLEETGISVVVSKLLYVQTLYLQEQNRIVLEQFWFAEPSGSTILPQGHVDHFGVVEEARWFKQSDIQAVVVYPKAIQQFWDIVSGVRQDANKYLGHFTL